MRYGLTDRRIRPSWWFYICHNSKNYYPVGRFWNFMIGWDGENKQFFITLCERDIIIIKPKPFKVSFDWWYLISFEWVFGN